MQCPICHAPLESAYETCAACGYSKQQPPPLPADRYMLRSYQITLEDLLGTTATGVLARLGHPDSKGPGTAWPPLRPLKDDGRLIFSKLVLTPGGALIEAHVFGLIPKKIIYPTPYETWVYHNVRGMTWLLFMTHNGACSDTPAGGGGGLDSRRKSVWERLTGLFGSRPESHSWETLAQPPPPTRGPRKPLAVAEVNSYSTGAVF